MKVKENDELNLNNSQIVLFGFELNPSQTTLFLILSFIGIFILPLILAEEIFLRLFQILFVDLPNYFSLPEEYRPFPFKSLFYFLAPTLINIIVISILLYLSIYSLKRILRNNTIKDESKRRIIRQDRIINWLGFKLSHGQSLFIFCFSLGTIFFIGSLISACFDPFFTIFEELCSIPVDSNHAVSHELLLDIIPMVINAIFFTLCIYSLIATRRKKHRAPLKRITKNYGLIIYIISLLIFIFYINRLFCHLFLFTDLANLLEITPRASTSYQIKDFIKVIVIIIISLNLMIACYFIKGGSYEETKRSNELTWFHIKLTPNKTIILLSLTFLSTIYFIYFVLRSLIFFPPILYNISFLVISFLIIIFCYYPFEKILKRRRLTNFIDSMKNSEEVITNWFKFPLKRLYSVVFLSLSSGFIILYVFHIMCINLGFRELKLDDFESYYLISLPILTTVIGIILAINIYTIKKTIHSIKSY